MGHTALSPEANIKCRGGVSLEGGGKQDVDAKLARGAGESSFWMMEESLE